MAATLLGFGPQVPANAARPVSAGTGTLKNWTGYVVDELNSNYYGRVEMDWVVPTVHAGTTYTRIADVWPGIGKGSGNNDVLIQAGTGSTQGPASTSYNAWFEVVPSTMTGEAPYPNAVVHAGDDIDLTIYYNPTSTGSNVSMYLDNYTTGADYPYSFTISGGWSGQHAEAIVERPCTKNENPCALNDLYRLAWFGSMTDTYANFRANGNIECSGYWPNTRYDMVDGAGTLLAYSRWADSNGCYFNTTRTSTDN